MNAIDPLARIRMQVMWNRLLAVVEEQGQTLVRTAFSTSAREAGDISAGVFDTEGRMLAQAVTGTPGHINSMALAVKHLIDTFPVATMRERSDERRVGKECVGRRRPRGSPKHSTKK